MTEKKYEKGSIIYREGDIPEFACTILSGKVEMLERSQGRETQVRVVEEGKTFGEFALFDPQTLRPFTARALENTVIEAVSADEFEKLFDECPKSILPFLRIAFEKMKINRVKEKDQTTGVLSTDITAITISPKSDKLKDQFKPMVIPIAALPFRIGGYPEDGEVSHRDQLHLNIPSQNNPLLVSRQHCEIGIEDGSVCITDLGSRFHTTVNGKIIGRGRGLYFAPLNKGINEVALGAPDSIYRLSVKCD